MSPSSLTLGVILFELHTPSPLPLPQNHMTLAPLKLPFMVISCMHALSLHPPTRFTHICIPYHAHPAYKYPSPTHIPSDSSLLSTLPKCSLLSLSGVSPSVLSFQVPSHLVWGIYPVFISPQVHYPISLPLLFIICFNYCVVYLVESSLLGSAQSVGCTSLLRLDLRPSSLGRQLIVWCVITPTSNNSIKNMCNVYGNIPYYNRFFEHNKVFFQECCLLPLKTCKRSCELWK